MTPRERYNELKSKASKANMPVNDPHKRYLELKAKAEPKLNMYERQAREDSGLTNFLSGMGGGVNSLIEGAKQAAGADNQAEINEHRKAMDALKNTLGGSIGNVAGQAGVAGVASTIPGANSYVGSAILSGALGASQPTIKGESRVMNTGLSMLGGLGGKWGGDKFKKMLSGNPNAGLNKAEAIASKKGAQLGFKQSPGYATGSKGLQKLEASMESSPFFSRPIDNIKSHNQTRMNQIAANALGEKSDTLDSVTLRTAKNRIGDVYEKVATNTKRQIDADDITARIAKIEEDFDDLLPEGGLFNHSGSTRKLFNIAAKGEATGKELQQLSSKLNKSASKQITSPMGDRDLGFALYDVKEIVDDYLQKGLSKKLGQEFADARRQYRTLIQLTKRNNIVNPSSGDVHPVALSNYLQHSDKNGYFYGNNQSDLYNAARFAQANKPIVGDSGTATRNLLNNDIGTLLLSPFTNTAARLYTTKPTQVGMQGLLGLEEILKPYLGKMGLLGGALTGAQYQE